MTTDRIVNEKIIVTRYGGPEALMLIEEPMPEPGKGEVRIRVQAAGVALADSMRREGLYPGTPAAPFTPGYDVAGVIDAVGDEALEKRLGTRAAAFFPGIGGYSRYACVQAEEAVEIPAEADMAEAAAVVLNYVTAYQMLHRFARVQAGDSVLIHGASGGVGTALLDLGRLYGLRMFGTASVRKHAALEQYGVCLIDYSSDDFVDRVSEMVPLGVKAVFDSIGYENWPRSFQVLGPEGVLVGYGFTSILQASKEETAKHVDGWRQLAAATAGGSEARRGVAYSITGGKEADPDAFRSDLKAVLELLAAKRIKPLIAASFPFREVRQAHAYMKNHAEVGKIVLTF